jgi:transposase
MIGIDFVEHEESYTSKCDAMAFEKIGKHEQYAGRRIRRGLFRSSTGKLINADQNGALNIMRKVVGDSYVRKIVDSGHSLCPIRHRNPFQRIAGSMQKV